MTYSANDNSPILIRDKCQREADILIRDFGSIWSFTPQTEAATNFMDELGTEGWQWLGGSLHVDHRPAHDLLAHIEAHHTTLDVFLI
jgi:hypothetical protein